MRDLGILTGGSAFAYATGINNRGQIAGYSNTVAEGQPLSLLGPAHAFSWERGTMIDLGTLPGAWVSAANAIDDHGHVVGSSTTASGETHGVLWTVECREDERHDRR